MRSEDFINNGRVRRQVSASYDLIVVGGGLTGICCSITAARKGIHVCLIQDRPVLGGNASSEIRVWALGATAHMGNNNRFSREGGVIDEILTENIYRNRDGNPILFDALLLDKVLAEKNITLLLNTSVFEVRKSSPEMISSVVAWNSSAETQYELSASLFADCSGDGVLGYLAGAPFRMGAEEKGMYGEAFAPDSESYGELLGDTIFFYVKDIGHEVKYIPPEFALKNAEKHISRLGDSDYFSQEHNGCKYWWIEYGGRLDTVYDTETIRTELLKIVYGIWDYIKNSGKYPGMANYTLEWVGAIPGKRESRRFVGKYTVSQRDIVEQKTFYDAVSYGGWAIDLHPADGVYTSDSACNQWHSKGIYQIPFRCFVGDDIKNLMFGGRIASSSHVANGSTRVMCTCAHGGQAIGMAAALCIANGKLPEYYTQKENVRELQSSLIETGHFIPGIDIVCDGDKVANAEVKVSSTLHFNGFENNAGYEVLNFSAALLFPEIKGRLPEMSVPVMALENTVLTVQLRESSKAQNYTPDIVLEEIKLTLKAGESIPKWTFDTVLEGGRYCFVCFLANKQVQIGVSRDFLPGITTVYNQVHPEVSNYGRQNPPALIGFESFEFWCPRRLKNAVNLALAFSEVMDIYDAENLKTRLHRPYLGSNSWCAESAEADVVLEWPEQQEISEITLFFDTDSDQAMESVQMGYDRPVMPLCVRDYSVFSDKTLLAEVKDNHQAVNHFSFPQKIHSRSIRIHISNPEGIKAVIYDIIVK